ncbi:MAG: ABC transporter substrate-binding protein [Gordonia amarae]
MNSGLSLKRLLRVSVAAGAAGALALGGLTACSSDDNSSDSAGNPAGKTTELPSNPATGDPIKIGFIASEGGAVQLPMLRTSGEAAARYLNENGGGIGGHKVELVVCKQSEEPASATKCANELVEKKVAAVVAPLSSQGAVMLPIITGAKIPYIAQAPVSRAEFATPGAYMLSGGTIAVLTGQAKTAAQSGIKKFTVLIGDSGDAATSVKAMATPIFQQAGVELKVVVVPVASADPTPEITAGLADKPGAVTVLGDTRMCVSAMKVLQSVAPDVKKYLIASCLDKPVWEAIGGHDKLIGAKAFTTVNLTSDDPSVTLYRSIMAKYSPDDDPQGLGYLGYQVVMSLGEIGKDIKGVTAADLRTALTTATDVPLPAAPGLTFTCNGKAMPMLPPLCSNSIIVSDIAADGKFENSTVIKN